MTTDILKTDINWAGCDVYIVGSGPNGRGYEIHRSAHDTNGRVSVSIVINRAMLARIRKDYWLCIASNLLKELWFTNAMHLWPTVRAEKGMCEPILAQGPLLEAYPETPYSVALAKPLGHGDYNSIPGFLRRGAGTVGCALQLAYQKQAVRCILVGVDMHGRGYFDGTENVNKRSIHPDGTWTQLPMLQGLIDHLKEQGMDVVSMSETKLNVEMI